MVEAQRLIDRYRLEQRLAAGGMGTVYEATDERLNRRVAVKLLKEELVDDPRFVERFRREARAVAALSHPNIASVFDYGADDGRDFIVMELIEGRDLAELLRSGPARAEQSRRHSGAELRRTRPCSRRRHRPSRRQARKHHRLRQRPGKGHRLRHRQGHR